MSSGRVIDLKIGHNVGKSGGPEDLSVDEQDYVGYFTNEHGEQLLFVQHPNEAIAHMYHSDNEWKPVEITGLPPTSTDMVEGIQRGETPDFELILDDVERAWIVACWRASQSWRDPEHDRDAEAYAAGKAAVLRHGDPTALRGSVRKHTYPAAVGSMALFAGQTMGRDLHPVDAFGRGVVDGLAEIQA